MLVCERSYHERVLRITHEGRSCRKGKRKDGQKSHGKLFIDHVILLP